MRTYPDVVGAFKTYATFHMCTFWKSGPETRQRDSLYPAPKAQNHEAFCLK